MKEIKGNLITLAEQGHFDVIIHGCNCFCIMGGGIAKEVRERHPEAYYEDCKTAQGDKGKLGKYSYHFSYGEGDHQFCIVNAYTQYGLWGGDEHTPAVDYDAVRRVFKKIKQNVHPEDRIAYPMIGAGLAGGDWGIISKIIDEEFEGLDHTLVVFDGSK